MMPVPTHLRSIAVARNVTPNGEPLCADLRCPCGGSMFQLLYPGQTHEYAGELVPCTAEIDGCYFFILKALCVNCLAQHLLLDVDFHGWDGFVCHDPKQAALPRPEVTPWKCLTCAGLAHKMVVHITGEGQQHFTSEAGESFDKERWPDAFGWFSLDTTCVACGRVSTDLVAYETM